MEQPTLFHAKGIEIFFIIHQVNISPLSVPFQIAQCIANGISGKRHTAISVADQMENSKDIGEIRWMSVL